MKRNILITLCLTLLALPGVAQQSPPNLVAAYDALADSILGLRRAEASFVTAVLYDHYRAAERAFKGPILGRKNWMFAGSDAGAERAAVVFSLIETCKLNGIEPFAYLRDVLARLPTHPASRIDELVPYRWNQLKALEHAA